MEDDNDDREDDDDRGSGNDQAESVNSPAAGNDKGARDLCGRRQGEGDVGFGEEVNDEGLGFRDATTPSSAQQVLTSILSLQLMPCLGLQHAGTLVPKHTTY